MPTTPNSLSAVLRTVVISSVHSMPVHSMPMLPQTFATAQGMVAFTHKPGEAHNSLHD